MTAAPRRVRPEFSIERKLDEIGRVIHQRRMEYALRIKKGALTQEEADRRIDCLKAIARDYHRQKRGRSK